VTTEKKKGCGCSTSLIIIVSVVFLALFVFGFMSGAVGAALFKSFPAPDWLKVPTPHVELPSEAILHFGDFKFSNTLLASLLTTAVLLSIAVAVKMRTRLIPGRFQAFIELGLEALLNFVESVAGKKYGRRFFPMIATIFLFVMFNAYLALLPFFGTVLVHTEEGYVPLFRAANTDLNVPLAIALCAFVFIEFWGLKALGAGHYFSEFFNFGQFITGLRELFTGKLKNGIRDFLFGFINIFIGLIELLSHFIRIVSFTFRLFGNMTAGEILLFMVAFLVPLVAGNGVYGLELLVGVLQALIFAGLTLVFATIAVKAGGDEGHEAH
jgi:F-type H+-transporting ATPase subunit a